MRFFASLVAGVVSFAFLEAAFGTVHNSDASLRQRHAGRSPSAPLLGRNVSLSERRVSTLEKRFDNARFSFYDAGLGACGKVNRNSDFIVALNAPQFDSEDFCFKTITITWKGKSAQAQIVDKCMECPYGALDFSRGLFDFFASQDLGYLYGTWTLGSGTPKPSKPSPTPKPTTTKEKPPPTPEPTTTSTSTKKTSTSARPTSTTPSSSSAEPKTSNTSAAPSPTDIAFPPDVLSQLDLVMLNLGGVAIGAAHT